MKVTTNNVPRQVVYGYELTPSERAEFDYLTEEELEEARLFRYRGELYDLGDFMQWSPVAQPTKQEWDGYCSDSFFSGMMVRYVDDYESVIVGRFTV